MRTVAALGALIVLSACAAGRSPQDLRASPPRQFQFGQPPAAVRNCILPGLDRLEPFNIQPGLTRPPQVRELGDKIEIFAQDETITLYVVDLTRAGRDGSSLSAYAPTTHVTSQIDAIARRCGAA
jgi:hypothetical protein